ncbi:hypothetical protein BC739_001880 [Kutzneria viridogrisea]|uniref:CAAX prenyl protease 2/Lysostaphin resistance protein A-like domain-containing protein n=1 Tax=Kutzneria viridogrisea TaxID=47990 RepID=A0ABR6BCT1_9PSEU|nr:hypothetical protein [Kutzneria viridogrisea]
MSADHPLEAVVRQAPLAFILLTAALTVPVVLLGGAPLPIGVNVPVASLAAFVPATVALLLLGREHSPVGAFLLRCVDPRVVRPRRWLLVALLLPVLLLAVSWVFSPPAPTPALSPVLPLLAVLFFASAVGEETGYTGYLLAPLRERFGPVRAALLIGTFSALLHSLGWTVQTGHSLTWAAGMALNTIASRALIVWLCERGGRSVLPAVLFHLMVNMTSLVFPEQFNPVVSGVTATALAVLVSIRGGWRGRTRSGA